MEDDNLQTFLVCRQLQ